VSSVEDIARAIEQLAALERRPIDAERVAIQADAWFDAISCIPVDELHRAIVSAHTTHAETWGGVTAAHVLAAWRDACDVRDRTPSKPLPDPLKTAFPALQITKEVAQKWAADLDKKHAAGDVEGVKGIIRDCSRALIAGAGKSACGLHPDLAAHWQTLEMPVPREAVCDGAMHYRYDENWQQKTVRPCPLGPLRNMRTAQGGTQ